MEAFEALLNQLKQQSTKKPSQVQSPTLAELVELQELTEAALRGSEHDADLEAYLKEIKLQIAQCWLAFQL